MRNQEAGEGVTTKQANRERVIGGETKRDWRIEDMEKKKKEGADKQKK